jgi:hypothetical protein
MTGIRREGSAFPRPLDRSMMEVEMQSSVGLLPWRRVLILALGLIALGAPGLSSRGGSPAAQTAPQATASPASPAAAPAPGGFDFAAKREEIFKTFYATGLDLSTAYTVTNLAIKKDNMTLLLKQGTVFLMKPIGGEVTGGAFIGDGEASMTPPSRAQRFMLNKNSGAETLKEPFTEAVLRFSDGTDKTIRVSGKSGTGTGEVVERSSKIFAERNSWLDGTRSLQLEMQYLENRISGLRNRDFFVADFHTLKHDWLTYSYNPAHLKENILTSSVTMGAKGRRYLVPWCQWHKMSDYEPTGHYVLFPDHDGSWLIRIPHHDLTINLPNTKEVQWEIRMQVEPLVDNLKAVAFDLDNNADSQSHWYDDMRPVSVTEVSDESGLALAFMHVKDQMLVILPPGSKAGVPLKLTAKGKAQVIYQLTAESYGLTENDWYPKYGNQGGRGSFDWTVRVPKPFLITGSGKVVREFEENGQNGLETRCDTSVEFPWVIFGRFQKATSDYVSEETKKTWPLTIHSFPTMTVTITDPELLDLLDAPAPFTVDLAAPTDKVKSFFNEWKEVLKLYEKIYGPYPYDELHIAQMAPQLDFGQSPQGFVQLTGAAFLSQATLTSDFVHGFVAHEFAHQWWGHQVDGATGDDEWMSESFAEYASGIFVKEYQGPKRFQRTLEEWKKSARLGDPQGPISTANMQSGPNGGDYRTYLLYSKGPYVLHMLRVQLDDEMYTKVMRSIQETYKNQNISTEMLLREVNRVTGSNYTYFFDQWFWDVGIPKFHYSWRSEKQPDGKFLITVHVTQEDKNHLKRVLMPIHIHAKGTDIPPQYKGVVQADQDIKLMSPVDPKDVTLDDDHTLLADISKAG